MARAVNLAVLGAGLIGKRHIEHIISEPEAELYAIVDPSPDSKELAAVKRVKWYPNFAAMIAEGKPDGIIVATPNQMHVANGNEAIAAGVPALIEKPIADDLGEGLKLVESGEKAGVAILTGHHRRHNPMIQRAKSIIEQGRLGRIVAVHGFFWLMKPDDYFDVPWRREVGAGPVLLNLIHDVDLLRYLCGEVEAVQAFQSNAVRNYPVDETTVVILRFANGALGTINVSDTVVGPWSWEQTTGENSVYPRTDQTCYHIGGTHGSLSVPRLELWTNEVKRSWWDSFKVERHIAPDNDPLRLQIQQFCQVIRGQEKPLVSGREGLMTLKVIDAVKRAASSGELVKVD
ncbi:Gfo/Idh/MocA family oxidoreductase [Bradyrhizobium tropiciagri]|uniref:Gfo/Idh/MocA family protein n=1 Tax=Bradyrhizobium tropiciagri TaxID=312253 RepID=UPI001BA7C303|nr:Gfo/Idh/MocA family oxidoreductase [Bradyrhizobium tropiciagri]MBR0898849.1 Gfo/Idh/MocA family oxidoreductase [Bradyrhizobium tropiciagri]